MQKLLHVFLFLRPEVNSLQDDRLLSEGKGMNENHEIKFRERVLSKSFLDRFYVDRLLPLIVQNPKTGDFEQVYVQNRQRGDYDIGVVDIRDDGMCNPSMRTAFAAPDGDKEIKQKTTNILHLLGY